MNINLTRSLIKAFAGSRFSLQDAYDRFPEWPKASIRGRLYEKLGVAFRRIGKGVYFANTDEESIALIEGDGRDLYFMGNGSVDCILTDHPWEDPKANRGGNRSFADYECFRYTQKDFDEKARVLKDGCFLVEIIPSENETNYKYLYEMKTMAENAGFQYYAKVPWIKGTFVANTGRKSKNTEDVLIFSKGKARSMRPDAKKDKADPTTPHYMSGAAGMLPCAFNVQPPSASERIHQAEKPVGLIEQLLDYFTLEGELVLDQFAGSGVVGEACLNKNRLCVLVEKAKTEVAKIVQRLGLTPYTPQIMAAV